MIITPWLSVEVCERPNWAYGGGGKWGGCSDARCLDSLHEAFLVDCDFYRLGGGGVWGIPSDAGGTAMQASGGWNVPGLRELLGVSGASEEGGEMIPFICRLLSGVFLGEMLLVAPWEVLVDLLSRGRGWLADVALKLLVKAMCAGIIFAALHFSGGGPWFWVPFSFGSLLSFFAAWPIAMSGKVTPLRFCATT